MMDQNDSENFTDVIFIKGKDDSKMEYRMTGGKTNKFMYDFRPGKDTSLGVGKADLFISQKYPIDRNGVNRLTNNGPDIGAYEFVPLEEDEK